MSEAIQKTAPTPDPEEADTDEEFRALWTDTQEAITRFAGLAKAADETGKPDIATIYREVSGNILSLMQDLVESTGGALVSLEDEIEALPGGGDAEDSQLLPEDAEKYLQLFGQFTHLLDELEVVVPKGEDGDAQREIFATLRRMTDGMATFTREITIGGDGDEDEDEEPEDDDEPPSAEE